MFKFLAKYPKGATTNDMNDIDYLSFEIMTGNISSNEVIAIALEQGEKIELSNGCIVKKNRINNWEVEFDSDYGRDSMGLELFLIISRQNIMNKIDAKEDVNDGR